jgi:hypothetical protein
VPNLDATEMKVVVIITRLPLTTKRTPPIITLDSLRHRLDTIAAATTTAAEALGDGAALDLPPAVLAELLLEVETLAAVLRRPQHALLVPVA